MLRVEGRLKVVAAWPLAVGAAGCWREACSGWVFGLSLRLLLGVWMSHQLLGARRWYNQTHGDKQYKM